MGCTAAPRCTLTPRALADCEVQWDGPAVGRKALAYPARGVIFIDSKFWASVRTVDGRRAILAHERAHLEGARCEACADRRAGEILREEGVPTARDGFRAMAGRLENRDGMAAGKELLEGFGLDGLLMHRERAAGVSPDFNRLLDRLDREGVALDGVRYRVAVGVDGGKRTSEALQLSLWAKGRRQQADGSWVIIDESQVVTYARTLAETKHGAGDALDLWVMLPSGVPVFGALQHPRWAELYAQLGAIGEAEGFEWGGRWKKPDRPHFQRKAGLPAQLGGAALLIALAVLVTVYA